MTNYYNAGYQPDKSSPPPTHINALFIPTVTVTITMLNSGDTTWYPPGYPAGDIPCHLGSQNPPNNMTWNFNRVDLNRPVSPGDEYTFTLTIDPQLLTPRAGNNPRVYNFTWQICQDGGIGWFGAQAPNVNVTVVDPNV